MYDTKWIKENFEFREGKLYRLRSVGRWKKGRRSGTKNEKNGYRYVSVNGRLCLEHRVIWVLIYGEYPDCDIDHINGVRDDNRLDNLRLATRGQNNINSLPQKNNTSGYKGAYYDKRRNRWYAEIWVNNKKRFLGAYDTVEEAGAAYLVAAKQIFGEEFIRKVA